MPYTPVGPRPANGRVHTKARTMVPQCRRYRYIDELIGGTGCPDCGSKIDEEDQPPIYCPQCHTKFIARVRRV